VSITSPSEGASLTAPASFDLTANASVSSGSISKVEYFANGVSLGSATSSPFRVTANIADPGSYTLTAVATANGVSATSPEVHITVGAAAAINLSAPTLNNGLFSFNYNTTAGLTYIVQAATALSSSGTFNWSSVTTNVASSATGTYSETAAGNSARFFRVGRVTAP
jgi:hypothetical protein